MAAACSSRCSADEDASSLNSPSFGAAPMSGIPTGTCAITIHILGPASTEQRGRPLQTAPDAATFSHAKLPTRPRHRRLDLLSPTSATGTKTPNAGD